MGETLRTRRRGDALIGAIIDAAWGELSTHGYDALRMETVAERAGTSKTVLYRRWSNRAELALAALRKHGGSTPKLPDTGTLRDDIAAVVRWLSQRYADYPSIVRGLMTELPDADGKVTEVWTLLMAEIAHAAVRRGEIAAGQVTARLLRVPLDLARYEMFVTRMPLGEAAIAEIVDAIVMPLLRSKP